MYRFLISFLILTCFIPVQKVLPQVKSNGVPYIKNYSIDDYSPSNHRASPQNWEIYQNEEGILFFGNTDGLLVFDGQHWRLNFLPNRSVLRSIGSDAYQNLYVGGESEFGKLSIDSAGKYVYQSLSNLVPDSIDVLRNIWAIDSFHDTLIFRSRNKLFFYSNNEIVKVLKTKYQYFHHFKYKDELYVFEAGKGLTQLTGESLKLVPGGDYYKNHTAWAIFPIGEDSLLLASPIDGLTLYHNNEFSPWNIPASQFLKNSRVYCGVELNDGNYAFGTQGAGVAIMNKKGEIVQLYNKSNGLQNNVVLDLAVDKNGNLWAALSNGISYIKLNSPFTYYTEHIGIPRQNYYVEKYKDHLFFSNDEGIYIKPCEDIAGNYTVNEATLLEGSTGQSWLFQKAGDFLLCGHNAGVVVIHNQKVHKILNIPVNVWNVLPDPVDSTQYIACTIDGFYIIQLTDDDIFVKQYVTGYTGNVVYAAFDEKNNLWVSDEMHGVQMLIMNDARDSVTEIRKFDTTDGLPSVEGNWIIKEDNQILITNPSEYGFYRFNNRENRFEPYDEYNERFNINGGITLFRKGPQGNYWIRDGEQLKVAKPTGDSIKELISPFLKFKGRNLERLSFVDDYLAVFGTDEYVLNYYYTEETATDDYYNAHIRKITSTKNDSIVFYGNSFGRNNKSGDKSTNGVSCILPYEWNALRFDFSSTYYEEPENTQYLVWLEGYEERPDNWIHETNKEYTNLKNGEYVFHVLAKNIYGEVSRESIFSFVIETPWYKTFYAYILYVLIFLVILFIGIRLYVRKLKADRDRLENIVKQRTSEIEQQKEEIKAQAEEVERINIELQKLSLVASKTDNAVIIAAENGRIEWINEGFTHLLGYTLYDLKTRLDGKLEEIGKRNTWKKYLNEARKNKASAIYESEVKTREGKTLNIQTTLTPILDNDNSIHKFIAISTNITKLKETQKELHKLIATKDKFFSIIAHDLKNPFHSLMGISELLKNNHYSYDQEKLQELYYHLYKVTHQGYQLLTNLLEWARSQTGRLHFNIEPVKISSLVDESIDMVQSTAESKNILIVNEIDSEKFVLADKNTITTVIRNLLSNAVKYSTPEGKVRIYSENLDGMVQIFVEDKGIGISPEDIDKLFRIDMNFSTRGTSDETGTGLGLILCREFVERNGGKIFVESVLGQGSTFSFTLRKPE